MVLTLIVMIGLAWLVQSVLGFLQIKHFNRKYAELRRLGRVAIGKRTGKFRAGTVVMFAIDKNNKVLKAAKMQGVTVFSRVRDLKGFEGIYFPKMKEKEYQHHDQLTRLAIMDALSSYDIIAKVGELQVKKGWIDYIFPKKKKNRVSN